MIHLYNETEIAKITIFVSDNFLNNEINNAKTISAVARTLNRKINSLKEKTTQNFLFDKERIAFKEKRYTRFETLVLVYLMITNTRRGSLFSKSFDSPESITYEIANNFYQGLIKFLNDERFKKDGEWYNFEQSFCKKTKNQQISAFFNSETVEEFADNEIEYLTKNFFDYVQLLEQIERYETLLNNAVKDNNKKVITKSDFSHFPIFSVDNEMIINSGMLVNYTYAEATKLLELINNNIENAIIKANEEAQSSLSILREEKAEKEKNEIFLIID